MRVPVVGGFNDSEKEMREIFDLLRGKGVRGVELLPYHKMGIHKYDGLGMEYTEFCIPSESQMEKFKNIFKEL